MQFENTQSFAQQLDEKDELKNFRENFLFRSIMEKMQFIS